MLRPSTITGRRIEDFRRSMSRWRNSFHSVITTSASAPAAKPYASFVYSTAGSLARAPAGREQDPCDVQAGRLSEVVGVGLEGQAEQADHLLVELLEAVPQLVDHEH